MKVFLDTNVLVAAFLTDHDHHARALPVVQAVHAGKVEGHISAHSLLETYAVLTRLPRAPRLTPSQVAGLIAENVVQHFTVVIPSSREYADLLDGLGSDNIVGGQVYDVLHLACARKCGAERIYTFNVRHFQDLGNDLASKITAP
jgi:predicted nucleic acid-binding protein